MCYHAIDEGVIDDEINKGGSSDSEWVFIVMKEMILNLLILLAL
jgi:hypothetical protein